MRSLKRNLFQIKNLNNFKPKKNYMINKNKSRRQFLELGVKSGLVLPFLGTSLLSCNSSTEEARQSGNQAIKKLSILILGGTSFLGPSQIAYALGRGHSVATFTRGKTKPTIHQTLFEQVEQLIGDRSNDLTALENRKWDVVIDNSGHDVEWARTSAALLKENADLYLFTSSTGVYYPYLEGNIKEDRVLLKKEPEGIEDEELKLEYWYGVMKTNSEIAIKEEFGADRTIIVRPTYMIGPGDKSDRFIHWPIRLSKGGETILPGKANDPIQYLDVRDAGEWMIRLIEEKKVGTFNAAGPKTAQNMYDFVEEATGAFDVATTFVKIDDYDFLKENKIPHLVPWIMPEENNHASALTNNQKALDNGLTFRPLVQSIKDTYNWWYSDAVTKDQRDKVELDPKSLLMREKEIIVKWKKR